MRVLVLILSVFRIHAKKLVVPIISKYLVRFIVKHWISLSLTKKSIQLRFIKVAREKRKKLNNQPKNL